jgi:hypothetical protein
MATSDSQPRQQGEPIKRYLLLVAHLSAPQTWSDSDDLDLLREFVEDYLPPSTEWRILDTETGREYFGSGGSAGEELE